MNRVVLRIRPAGYRIGDSPSHRSAYNAEMQQGRLSRWVSRRASLEMVFSAFYRMNAWFDSESRSGPGSTIEITRAIRDRLPLLVRELEVRRLLDVPCGDFNWMKEVDLEIDSYIGGDIVAAMVRQGEQRYGNARRRFQKLDVTSDDLPRVDLLLCRDCLVHLPESRVLQAIENIKRSGSTYLLTTTFPLHERNQDIAIPGRWRMLNLEAAPYHFPAPLELIDEGNTWKPDLYPAKSLGLWRIADL